MILHLIHNMFFQISLLTLDQESPEMDYFHLFQIKIHQRTIGPTIKVSNVINTII